jgi:hypothetical protein
LAPSGECNEATGHSTMSDEDAFKWLCSPHRQAQ